MYLKLKFKHLVALIFLFGVTACSNPYVITTELEERLTPNPSLSIGDITDGLPEETPEEDKPTTEIIGKFKQDLRYEIDKKNIFKSTGMSDTAANYEISGSILTYKKGSGFLRFLFGRLAGGSKITVSLTMTNNTTNETIFAGNFTQTVTDWTQKGEKMFEKVAKSFAKALDKKLKKLAKEKEKERDKSEDFSSTESP